MFDRRPGRACNGGRVEWCVALLLFAIGAAVAMAGDGAATGANAVLCFDAVLTAAVFKRSASEARSDVYISLRRRADEWADAGVAAPGLNTAAHTVEVAEAVGSQSNIVISLAVAYGTDRWVPGGPARYTLSLSRIDATRWTGHYEGTLHAQAVTGTAQAVISPLVPPSGPPDLTIFHVNDTHGNLLPKPPQADGDGVGTARLARASAILRSEREVQGAARVLMLHAGDFRHVHGQDFLATETRGMADVVLLNLLGLDALAVGNHDDKNGLTHVQHLQECSRFPWLSANVLAAASEDLLFKPYLIKRVGALRVAIVGFHPNGYTFRKGRTIDALPCWEQIAAELKDRTDLLVVLSHQGANGDIRMARSAAHAPHVIVGGHSHHAFSQGIRIRREDGRLVLVTQAGVGWENLGRISLWCGKDEEGRCRVRDVRATLIALDDTTLPVDPVAEKRIDELNNKAQEARRTRLATPLVLTPPELPAGMRSGAGEIWALRVDAILPDTDCRHPVDVYLTRSNTLWTAAGALTPTWNNAGHEVTNIDLVISRAAATGSLDVVLHPDPWTLRESGPRTLTIALQARIEGRRLSGTHKSVLNSRMWEGNLSGAVADIVARPSAATVGITVSELIRNRGWRGKAILGVDFLGSEAVVARVSSKSLKRMILVRNPRLRLTADTLSGTLSIPVTSSSSIQVKIAAHVFGERLCVALEKQYGPGIATRERTHGRLSATPGGE